MSTTVTVTLNASGFYDEVEIEDMEYNDDDETYYFPCPCGDRFQITMEQIRDGEEIAKCPSCSLTIKVIFNPEDFDFEDD